MSAVPNDVLKYVRDPQNDEDPQETAEWLVVCVKRIASYSVWPWHA
jgi:hypothetical protein